MDPRRVLTFRAVAHRRSFSDAARELSLSQPAVSNQIAGLERELGTTLLERRPGGLQLTPAGEVVLEHAEVIADRLALARTQVARMVAERSGRLRIGAFPTALASLVPYVVDRLRDTHPGLRVSFEEGTRDALSAKLQHGDLDLAIVFEGAGVQPAEERAELLMRERFLVALPTDHRLASKRAVHLIDLRDEDWTVALIDGGIVQACREAGFEPNVVSIARDPVAIGALVARGLAVTLVPELLADAFGDLALRPLAGRGMSRDVYALLPPGAAHPVIPDALEALSALSVDLAQAKSSGRHLI